MFKKSIFVMVALLATITSFAATAADYEDIVYAKDVKVTLGGQVEIPIYIKNPSYPVKSFEFDMALPDGVSFAKDGSTQVYTVCSDFSKWSVVVGTKTGAAANTTHAIVSYQQSDAATVQIPQGSDREVFTITLQVDENTTAGAKTITMKNIMLAEDANNEHKILSGDEAIISNVNVQRAQVIEKMGEGYGLIVDPFTAQNDGNVKTISIKVKNATVIKSLSFDLKLPKGLLMCDTEFNTTKATLTTNAGTNLSEDLVTNTNYNREGQPNEVHVAFTGSYPAKGTKKYINIHDSETELFTLVTYVAKDDDYVEEQGDDYWPRSIYEMNAGLNELKIENISMTDKDGNVLSGEYVSSVLKGTPTDSNPIIYGDITSVDQIETAIPTGATSVDISQATASDAVVEAVAENAQTKNANAIVYAPSTYEGTKDNVVVSDEDGNLSCKSFKLTDGATMNVPASFTAASASYSRTMSTNWGTICLPYTVQSNAAVAYYNIEKLESGTLYLTKIDELAAGTPALVKKLSGGEIAPKSTSVQVSSSTKDKVSGSATMYGCFSSTPIVDEGTNYKYYIANNLFYHANVQVNVPPFRAYFTVSGENARSISIADPDDTTTAVNALVGEGEVKIETIYDEGGRKLPDLQSGLNIVKMTNGKVQKIMVE